jgi:uncharacterized protein YpuA (DUF1002 family)
MDLKQKIEELAQRVKNDKALQAQFMKDPVAAAENLLGVDLPEEQIKQIAEGVMAKLSLQKLTGLFK